MSNITTDLIQWGDVGSIWPSGYHHIENEAPVDAWDNKFKHETIRLLKDELIPTVNNRLESGVGAAFPSSGETGQLFWNTSESSLSVWSGASESWKEIAQADDLVNHAGDEANPHSVTLEQVTNEGNLYTVPSGSVGLDGSSPHAGIFQQWNMSQTDWTMALRNTQGNFEFVPFVESDTGETWHWSNTFSFDTTNENWAFDRRPIVSGSPVLTEADADGFGTDVSNDGTTVVNNSTDINFAGGLDVTDDGDNTVTVSSDLSGHMSSDNPHGVTLEDARSAGNSIQGDIDFNLNNAQYIRQITMTSAQNDIIAVSDGSLGSNTTPFTFLFDDRDFRFLSSTGVGTVLRVNQSGSVEVPQGNLDMNQNQIKNFCVDVRSSDPSNPQPGQEWIVS